MFNPKTHCVVVVGAQWGDEGKGKLVDVLAERADYVVRYQGGANAGHTVWIGDAQFILHQIPSGILHDRCTCVVGNGVVLDPETFFTELDGLTAKGVNTRGRIVISDRAHLVLPYHKLLDKAHERSQNIGTTGRGIGPAYEDKIGRRGVRVGDLRHLESAKALLSERVARANQLLAMMGSSELASEREHHELLERLAPRLLPMAVDAGCMVHTALKEGRRVLLEGAQGALLDVDHGTYPFVTSSNTTAGGAAIGAGVGPTAIDEVLGVVKAYTTRVGNGPLPTQAEPGVEEHLRKLGGEFGATTGRPRRCGWFDATVVRYSVRVNGLTGLAVTKLDVLDTFAEIPVCTDYTLEGEDCHEMPSDIRTLERVTPRYEMLPGWRKPTTGARKLADLPPEARAYLDRLQDLSGAPIRFVSVGTRRDQIIGVS
ncbi:MAG: adenylosuccinate synthase [Gemmatimonadetes bacterium]|nr:adenylosuccinate synthase [Gemmatimonadota bacterium]MBK7783794.1 adenylosuccinate synthase [Gemmatimonadota bacterium]MBK7924732.1 adenylosuccinate synthase [Gemmatimonadota bacterium]MBK9690592.1 adenylosuccinate synthase [Gemmatimonadota bacterium]MBP9200022.1 adenylosuccinate synthase [Gemmatimonadales bacterium]